MVMCIVSALVTSLVILSAVFGLHFDTFASFYFSYNKEVLLILSNISVFCLWVRILYNLIT